MILYAISADRSHLLLEQGHGDGLPGSCGLRLWSPEKEKLVPFAVGDAGTRLLCVCVSSVWLTGFAFALFSSVVRSAATAAAVLLLSPIQTRFSSLFFSLFHTAGPGRRRQVRRAERAGLAGLARAAHPTRSRF